MKPVTRIMINDWGMKNVDWMGYLATRKNPFTFHHLYIFARNGGLFVPDNGAILCQNTSHPYIHVIENTDEDRFNYIQSILMEVNEQGFMTTYEQFRRIDDCLDGFEREYSGTRTSKGKMLIKEPFTRRIM